ncbi:hypothetical protein E2C01_060574 [Portunus trituberculatus]|uniref:Uncharacterized protein n=1 Tax=Portunus trituberculatus TaxID=210409 RepID=A0A5B7HAV2_PORTR|nr:hypothetical protein [Portunus trituberculatus]
MRDYCVLPGPAHHQPMNSRRSTPRRDPREVPTNKHRWMTSCSTPSKFTSNTQQTANERSAKIKKYI